MPDPFVNVAKFLASYGASVVTLVIVILGFCFLAALDNPVAQARLKVALFGVLIGCILIAGAAAGYFGLPLMRAVNPAYTPAPTTAPASSSSGNQSAPSSSASTSGSAPPATPAARPPTRSVPSATPTSSASPYRVNPTY